ncbi:GNAT family N-acetyltransferase [Cognatiyoonia sp. IB215446]|uniref:GNAT family N-acetyltransferase n=1 Tax=Cognatiyoonia sp. IB215446 TaxID=3097355 RepID=UPI002A0BEE00|nr:GNAT family N-acetyltransferase [Cognatiyoonia sp. IB215446]MDX8347176.1 GNAT family N-acetyltransferase [Cognatiyoonia sp. IB215446]
MSAPASDMIIRDAKVEDVPQMSAFLGRIAEMGRRVSPWDEDFVLRNYINAADKIQCALAEDDGKVLGFQSLKLATEGNIYDVTPGWGIIGTHVNPDAARRGVGRSLFTKTLRAAHEHGLKKIDASISAANPEGLAYYEAMGFRTYRSPNDLICKCYDL